MERKGEEDLAILPKSLDGRYPRGGPKTGPNKDPPAGRHILMAAMCATISETYGQPLRDGPSPFGPKTFSLA